jgi:hypothetical protein
MLDGIFKKQKKTMDLDYALARFILRHKNSSVLLSQKHGKVRNFTTSDSKLYFTQKELLKMRQGNSVDFATGMIESVSKRREKKAQYIFSRKKEDRVYSDLKERYASLRIYFSDTLTGYTHGVSMVRAWNLSLIGSLIFGMFLMTMIYRYLGPGAQAKMQEAKDKVETEQIMQKQEAERVLGEELVRQEVEKKAQDEYTAKLLVDSVNAKQADFEKEIREMVKGYPIEQMVSEIAKKDRVVAAFLIGIARKESSWGVHVPVLNGEDCFNYWGYRGIREKMGTGGHTCFNSPKDAVDTVAKRIEFLVLDKKLNTPDKMVIWKCGSNCAVTGGQAAANKWIDDVNFYFRKFDLKKDNK